jgi:RNA polymerase sigma-70 factor (ECF subfamily)
MGRLSRGDRDALTLLMERHYRRIYRIALSYLRNPDDALDCTQEIFVKVFEKSGRWRGDSEVGPWLTRVAVNQAIDHYRKTRRRLTKEEPILDHDMKTERPSPEGTAHAEEVSEKISRALRALPERQRAVFVLRHYDDLSLPEIATSLGMRIGTVKSNLHRALGRLRIRLAEIPR